MDATFFIIELIYV